MAVVEQKLRSMTEASPEMGAGGLRNVFAAEGGGYRNFFERLWGPGGFDKKDFGDLWNEKKFWEGREMVGKAEKPHLNGAEEGEEDAQADNRQENIEADPQQLTTLLADSLEQDPRRMIEARLEEILERPMPEGRVDLNRLAEDPEGFMSDLRERMSQADRNLFDRDMGDYLQDALPGLDDEYEQPPLSHDALAFMACVTSPQGNLMHGYLRDRGVEATVHGADRKKDNDADEHARRFAQQQAALDLINTQLALIDQSLTALYQERDALNLEFEQNKVRLEKLGADREEIDGRISELDTDIASGQHKLGEIGEQLAEAEAAAEDNEILLTDEQRDLLERYQNHKAEAAELLGTNENGDQYTFTTDTKGNVTYHLHPSDPPGSDSIKVTDPAIIAELNAKVQTPEGRALVQENMGLMEDFSGDVHNQETLNRVKNQLTKQHSSESAIISAQIEERNGLLGQRDAIDAEIKQIETRQTEIQDRLDQIQVEVARLEEQKEQLTAEQQQLMQEMQEERELLMIEQAGFDGNELQGLKANSEVLTDKIGNMSDNINRMQEGLAVTSRNLDLANEIEFDWKQYLQELRESAEMANGGAEMASMNEMEIREQALKAGTIERSGSDRFDIMARYNEDGSIEGIYAIDREAEYLDRGALPEIRINTDGYNPADYQNLAGYERAIEEGYGGISEADYQAITDALAANPNAELPDIENYQAVRGYANEAQIKAQNYDPQEAAMAMRIEAERARNETGQSRDGMPASEGGIEADNISGSFQAAATGATPEPAAPTADPAGPDVGNRTLSLGQPRQDQLAF